MLQIRLNKGTTSSIDGVTGLKSTVNETVNVACPDHLVLADLPVAKGLGSATSASIVKIVGRRSRRQLAERVHFCVRCDFPIAIYGRLSPCDHAFCLDCARSDSICYLCDERIQKIQTIKMMEGIFICAAPHCLKSFLKKSDFESHIHENHADLLHPNMKKEEISEQEGSGTKQSSTLDTTLRGPPRPGFPSSASHPLNDREDKARRQQPRDQPPPRPFMPPKPPQFYGQVHPSDAQADNRPAGLDGPGQNQMQQHNVDNQGGAHQEFGQFSEKQPGIMPDPHREYPPMYTQQPPNFPMPLNANPMMMGPPPFGFPPFPSDGAPPFYGAPAPYEVARSDSTGDGGSEQGAVNMGFAPGPGGPVNYPEAYPRPWNVGPTNIPFEAVQGAQGLMAAPQQGMPPPPPPPGPPPPHIMQHKHGYFSGDINSDERSYGWQSERRDGFGNSQD